MIAQKLNHKTELDILIAEITNALQNKVDVHYNVRTFESVCIPKKMDYMCDYDTTWGAENKLVQKQKVDMLIFTLDEVEHVSNSEDYVKRVFGKYHSNLKEGFIIQKTIEFVKEVLHDAEGGHDWWHIQRVLKLSNRIAKTENANWLIVSLGALLHDIADSKFHDGDETIGPHKARTFLQSVSVEGEVIDHVEKIIANISFKGGNHTQKFKSIELDIIQDADRLDALGAIGIARTFNYGGHKNRKIYDPKIPPQLNMTKEEYKNSTAPTINHFYEKLLLIKDRMNTVVGKKMAQERHQFMENYLKEFYKEWNVEE